MKWSENLTNGILGIRPSNLSNALGNTFVFKYSLLLFLNNFIFVSCNSKTNLNDVFVHSYCFRNDIFFRL